MADSPNVSLVRRLYQARGNPDVIRQVLASNVRWEVVDGFPYGAVYVGLDRVLRDFFAASSPTLTNSSRTAPSFSSQVNASSLSAAIRGVSEGAVSGSPRVSLTCGPCKTGCSFGCSSVPIPFSWLAPWQMSTKPGPKLLPCVTVLSPLKASGQPTKQGETRHAATDGDGRTGHARLTNGR
jgi:hypothetical protein